MSARPITLTQVPLPKRHSKRNFGLPITQAEMEAWLELTKTGHSVKGIAAALGKSPKTIECQFYGLHKKLGTHTLLEMAVLGWRRGIQSYPSAEIAVQIASLQSAISDLQERLSRLVSSISPATL